MSEYKGLDFLFVLAVVDAVGFGIFVHTGLEFPIFLDLFLQPSLFLEQTALEGFAVSLHFCHSVLVLKLSLFFCFDGLVGHLQLLSQLLYLFLKRNPDDFLIVLRLFLLRTLAYLQFQRYPRIDLAH